MKITNFQDPDLVFLNVGGRSITTTWNTLVYKYPDSILANHFGPEHFEKAKKKEMIYIDYSPDRFEAILNYIRTGS